MEALLEEDVVEPFEEDEERPFDDVGGLFEEGEGGPLDEDAGLDPEPVDGLFCVEDWSFTSETGQMVV